MPGLNLLVRSLFACWRRYLDDHGFEEVDTPVLQTKVSGALAKPFVTQRIPASGANRLNKPV